MNNYYETCLNDIRLAINEGNITLALKLLDDELNLPYVPQPYFDTFVTLRDSLRIDTEPNAKYFESLDAIHDALKGNDSLKLKALMSLERMNLRAHLDEIEGILMDDVIDDWMKRQVLLFLMDQDINHSFEILLDSKSITLNPRLLTNPIGSQEYLRAYDYLTQLLESDNPSLLMLCIAELDESVMKAFPFELESIDGSEIMERVRSYLNAG